MKKFQAFLMKNKKAKILDVGTGNGNFIHTITNLSDDFSEITGIDNSAGAIAAGRESFSDSRIHFLQMDALHMTFENDTFDMVCLSNSLHHLEHMAQSFQEMERVLKPGGYFILSEMVSNDLTVTQRSHMLMHHYAAEVDRAKGIFHDVTYSNQRILEILHKNCTLGVVDSWILDYPRSEALSQEGMDWLFDTIDRVQKRVEQMEEFDYFQQKADEVKTYITRNGFESATQIMVILQQ